MMKCLWLALLVCLILRIDASCGEEHQKNTENDNTAEIDQLNDEIISNDVSEDDDQERKVRELKDFKKYDQESQDDEESDSPPQRQDAGFYGGGSHHEKRRHETHAHQSSKKIKHAKRRPKMYNGKLRRKNKQRKYYVGRKNTGRNRRKSRIYTQGGNHKYYKRKRLARRRGQRYFAPRKWHSKRYNNHGYNGKIRRKNVVRKHKGSIYRSRKYGRNNRKNPWKGKGRSRYVRRKNVARRKTGRFYASRKISYYRNRRRHGGVQRKYMTRRRRAGRYYGNWKGTRQGQRRVYKQRKRKHYGRRMRKYRAKQRGSWRKRYYQHGRRPIGTRRFNYYNRRLWRWYLGLANICRYFYHMERIYGHSLPACFRTSCSRFYRMRDYYSPRRSYGRKPCAYHYGYGNRCAYGRCKPKPKLPKCGKKAYSKRIQRCCNGVLHRRKSNEKCCGRLVYKFSTHFCSNGKVYDSKKYSLCKNVVYDKNLEFCFNEKVYKKAGPNGICCGKLFNRLSHFCFECKTYLTGFYMKCGKSIHNIKTTFCYMECPFDRVKYAVCNKRIISTAKYKCVNNVITSKIASNENVVAKKEMEKFELVPDRERRSTKQQSEKGDSKKSKRSSTTGVAATGQMSTKCRQLIYP